MRLLYVMGYTSTVILCLLFVVQIKPSQSQIEDALLQHDFGTNNALLQGLIKSSGLIGHSIVVKDCILYSAVYDLDGKLIAVALCGTVKFVS